MYRKYGDMSSSIFKIITKNLENCSISIAKNPINEKFRYCTTEIDSVIMLKGFRNFISLS